MADKIVDIGNVKWGKTQTRGAADWQRRQKKRMRVHSRVVVSLKVLFPSMAAVLIGLVILWPQLKARHQENISLIASQSDEMKAAGEQAMVNPRFFTVDDKGEPFNMTADRAFELGGETRRVQLDNIKADILLKKDRWIALDAVKGVYSQADDTMELLQQVNMYTETGEEITTTQALINLKNRNIVGTEHVVVQTPDAHAEAEGFAVSENGTVIRLNGKTKAVFFAGKKGK